MPGLGAHASLLQPLPMLVCCAVYGAIIHSEDNEDPASLLTGWPFTSLLTGTDWKRLMETRSLELPARSCLQPGRKLERDGS